MVRINAMLSSPKPYCMVVVMTIIQSSTVSCQNQQPLFVNFQQNLVLSEHKENGSLIQTFDVTDAESSSSEIILGLGDDFTRETVFLNQTTVGDRKVRGHAYLINQENLDIDRGVQQIKLYFTATDGTSLVTTLLTVYLTDVNDNKPEFSEPTYVISIPENSAINSSIPTNISAKDLDQSLNGMFTISLKPSGQSSNLYENVFTIDENGHNLIQHKALDYETLSFYQYQLSAVDRGSPPLTGTAAITIQVKDVQDTPPNFQRLPYIFNFPENQTWEGSEIFALDGDRGIPRNVTYHLQNSKDNCSSLFSLNSTTGKLGLNVVKLDRDSGILYENQGVCRLIVTAKEKTGNGPIDNSTASTTVTITIEDINDNIPTFNSSNYEAYVMEEMTNIPLTIVGSTGIGVYDLDQGSNSEFRLEVKNTSGTIFHGIKATPDHILSGSTILLRLQNDFKFDYEIQRNLTLQVIATEINNSSHSTTCTVTVHINNTNDNDPVFPQQEYNATIPENSSSCTEVIQINATDRDLGEYGKINYTLKGSSDFRINEKNGTVYTTGDNSSLDRETRDTYYLTVLATDGGDRRTVATLTVTLSDVNDNSPEFLSTSYEMSIRENTTIFTPNIIIKAIDGDQMNTSNSEVMFSLHPPGYLSNNFTINNITGQLIALEPLDYERLNKADNGIIQLIVCAYDLGSPRRESNTTVKLNAQDENDNIPKFEEDVYRAAFPENKTQGYSVINVNATDDDATDPNNQIRYYIEKGGADHFRVNGVDGTITVDLNARFDRETLDFYNLTVIAADRGTPPLTGTVNVLINITDVNDESPTFQKRSYDLQVNESLPTGSIVGNYTATDKDENFDLQYSIFDVSAKDSRGQSVNKTLVKDYFCIDETNGTLFVEETLDRETATQLTVTFIVSDTNCEQNCPQNDTAILNVEIADANDEPPKFRQNVYTENVSESAEVGTNVITLVAYDIDTVGPNPEYNLTNNPNNAFSCEETTGTITTAKQLDRETRPQINITVMASDGINNSTCLVTVIVTDFNDNSPVFQPFTNPVNITEGNYTDEFVVRVNATDDDIGENAVINYKLEGSVEGLFQINSTTGDIVAVGNIDRESHPPNGKMEIRVLASNPPETGDMTNTTTLTINILDMNDNSPNFSKPSYNISVLETKTKTNTSIVTVQAEDPDAGRNGTVTFDLNYQDVMNLFYIDGTSGTVYANDSMADRIQTFVLNVTAKDGATPPRESYVGVFITVIDENNNDPQFHLDPNPQFQIYECQPNGTHVTTINATDKDFGANGKISYSFVNGSGLNNGPFQIDQNSGNIQLFGKISNEIRSEYKIRIQAEDGGDPKRKTTSDTITIKVLDVNNHPPQFSTPTRNATVKENTNQTLIITVQAFDKDSDAQMRYRIESTEKYYKYFHVNSTTGVVTVIKPFDREEEPVVNVTITAIDSTQSTDVNGSVYCTFPNGTAIVVANTTEQTIIVTVLDVDDNPPDFIQRRFQKGIRKNITPNTVIYDLKEEVTDLDEKGTSDHLFKTDGNFKLPPKIRSAVQKLPSEDPCNNGGGRTPVCLYTNGTIISLMVFEEDMSGTLEFTVTAWDKGGNDTAKFLIDIIVDSQMAKMEFYLSKQEVELRKENVTRELSIATGYTFVPDVIKQSDGRTILEFYVKEPNTSRILSAREVVDLIDRYGEKVLSLQIRTIEEAYKEPVKQVDEKFKQIMILAGATVLEALIICILVFVACRSKGKFERKLKAASVTTKDEKDTTGQMKAIVPGSNVYATMTNPILNKDVPKPNLTEADNLSDTLSQNSLDSNAVGVDGIEPEYRMTEEKEAVMDMYGDDFYQPDTDIDPLDMVISMHDMEKEQNGHAIQNRDEDQLSDYEFAYGNPAYELETTEV